MGRLISSVMSGGSGRSVQSMSPVEKYLTVGKVRRTVMIGITDVILRRDGSVIDSVVPLLTSLAQHCMLVLIEQTDVTEEEQSASRATALPVTRCSRLLLGCWKSAADSAVCLHV
jgi:hypothetical protein